MFMFNILTTWSVCEFTAMKELTYSVHCIIGISIYINSMLFYSLSYAIVESMYSVHTYYFDFYHLALLTNSLFKSVKELIHTCSLNIYTIWNCIN